jgi:hypothetical protein
MGRSSPEVRKIFDPRDPEELLRAWLLHLHKGRDRHDLAARHYDRIRTWLGGSATLFAATAGTSIFAALQKETSSLYLKVAVIAVSLLSAILTGLNSFLNLAERTEKHRATGVQYKALIWRLEQLRLKPAAELIGPEAPLEQARQDLQKLEMSAPVVPERLYEKVEHTWRRRCIKFEDHADKLGDKDCSQQS